MPLSGTAPVKKKKFGNLFKTFYLTSDIKLNPLSVNPTEWSNTLKQFVGNLPTNCLSVVDHFVKLGIKGLTVLLENLALDLDFCCGLWIYS